jgi:hypothetical protein
MDVCVLAQFRLTPRVERALTVTRVDGLFNRVQLRGNQMVTNLSGTGFGRMISQGGFMRVTQVMFRYSW